MVFSSVPVYLDPPNWNQVQRDNHTQGGLDIIITEAHQQQMTASYAASMGMSGSSAAIRPNSMAERARLAKIPQPELALKCPRCESTNTKFCYFNNYSLSQPRHFCKTCRRYWTRGGALRNVPVGGGFRRNKRNKSSKSNNNSTTTANSSADHQAVGGASSSSSTATGGGSGSGLGAIPSNIPALTQLPFMSSLHPLAHDYGHGSNLGLGFTGIHSLDVELGSNLNIGLEQWRIPQMQQFPFMGGLEPPALPTPVQQLSGLYAFDLENSDGFASSGQVTSKVSSSALITQMASVKMEDSVQGFSLPRQYLGLHGSEQIWGGNGGGASSSSTGGWNANFNSSASSNIL